MEISGIVVAASEVIRLNDTDGFLFTLYNIYLDLHFCVLAHGSCVFLWKNIQINHFYKFTHMKVGALETYSAQVKVLLKPTIHSSYFEIEEQDVEKFVISDYLISAISIPAHKASTSSEFYCLSKVISYQGIVTNNSKSNYGRFELDNKVILYITFNAFCSSLIEVGSEIFVSNVHLMTDYKGSSVLVCCGLSSMRNVNNAEYQEQKKYAYLPPSSLIQKYALNIYDLLWIERLSEHLKLKFSSLILEDVSFESHEEFFENILQFFLCEKPETLYPKKLSVIEEYLSYPHKCSAFLENKLFTDCKVFSLSDILEEAFNCLYWIEITKDWKFSIRKEDSVVLIGMLYVSSDGTLIISDNSNKLSIVLTEECNECIYEQNIMKNFENFNSAFLIALQEYDVIFERVCYGNGKKHFIQYLRTSSCRFFPLAKLNKSKDQFDDFSFHFSCQSQLVAQKCTAHMNLSSKSIAETKCSKFLAEDSDFPSIPQCFLVLNKLWTSSEKSSKCFKVLVTFIPDESTNDYTELADYNLVNNSHNYYETNDDLEFVNLITEMSNLCIENKTRLGYLSLENPYQYAYLCPGQTYIIYLNTCDIMNNLSLSSQIINNINLAVLQVTSDMKIQPDVKCKAQNFPEDYAIIDCIGVKEVLLKKRIPVNSVVVGVLVEKKYFDFQHAESRNSKVKPTATLCLRIQDVSSVDSIFAYIPFFSENICGLLPGMLFEFYGFLCCYSKSGNLYLKASSTYSIQVKKLRTTDYSTRKLVLRMPEVANENFLKNLSSGIAFDSTFRCISMVIKIVSAEIFTLCRTCKRKFRDNCLCALPGEVKIKVSCVIDDGNHQYLAYSYGKTAKKILGFDHFQWNCFYRRIQMRHKPIQFFETMQVKDITYLPIINQVFYYYCSSKAMCRKLMVECAPFPNPDFNGFYPHSILCKSACEQNTNSNIMELYVKLKNLDHKGN